MQSPNSCKYESEDAITEWANGCNGKEVEFIKPIATILHKDYKKMSFKVFEDKMAWDADEYEVVLKKGGDRAETIDFVVGLANHQLLMVEAKLNVVKVDNLKQEIEEKIIHTKRYLVSSTTFRSCATPSIVLLGNKKNNIQQNINKFMRLRSYKRDIQAMSLDTFYERYFAR